MLEPERRMLFKYKGRWYAKPVKAAYGIQVSSWKEGMKLVFGTWESFLDWYSSNLMY
jgi:hypothetical protein